MKLFSLRRTPQASRNFTLCLSVLCLAGVLTAAARDSTPPYSAAKSAQSLANVGQLSLKATDVAAELKADAAQGKSGPQRFAVPHDVTATPATHGTWETVEGGRLWRLRVVAPGSTDLNFGFSSFWLPEGATLHVLAESEYYFQGPYTAQDNAAHGQLWTALVPGEAAVIEVFVPTGVQPEPQLILSRVGAGYRDWFGRKDGGGIPKSGACNIDVVCPQTAGWENEIRSVGVYTLNGAFTCTGTLIGNAQNNFRSFFLTANHCEVSAANAPSMVVYWNFQSPTCGALSGGSLSQNQSGATFRAAKAEVDFCLVELSQVPSPAYRVYYSGWDRSGTTPPGVVGIHHPNTDEKAFSKSTNPARSGNSCIGTGGIGSHWLVIWTEGTTEPGSSGSGIWNLSTKRLVGTLSGGEAACDNPGGEDCYGKFSVAWNSGATAAERLSDWLDPLSTGVMSIAGADAPPVFPVSAGSSLVAESCTPANNALDPGEPVTLNFSIRNMGLKASTNLVATLLPGNGIGNPSAAQSYGAIASGATVSRVFSMVVTSACGSAISPTLQLQDGASNLGTVSYNLQVGTTSNSLVFSQNFDGAVVPALPAGWIRISGVTAAQWVTQTGVRDTIPNAAFAPDNDGTADSFLRSPVIALSPGAAQLSFRHWYNTELWFDGGVLEVSINGGAFTDIVTAGGSFGSNGYNDWIETGYGSPIAGRDAWTGNSGGFVTTVVNLPAAAVSRNVQFQWRMASDESLAEVGWYVDTVKVFGVQSVCCNYAPLLVDTRKASPSTMAFSFDTAGGRSYVVETTTNLTSAWTPVQTNAGNGLRQSVTNSVNPAAARFFRVQAR
jgi:hypothetical protein